MLSWAATRHCVQVMGCCLNCVWGQCARRTLTTHASIGTIIILPYCAQLQRATARLIVAHNSCILCAHAAGVRRKLEHLPCTATATATGKACITHCIALAAISSTSGMWAVRRHCARTGATTMRRQMVSSGWWTLRTLHAWRIASACLHEQLWSQVLSSLHALYPC